ncbi:MULTISPECIES: hypothetical protein [Cupriavidus]|uniref:hypothetical protein n=1 Tax=Cupriavidus TaxID=106589 RepID=UPI000372AE1F|nr:MULTISPECIES: hypothetical protein [Cupriavidus]
MNAKLLAKSLLTAATLAAAFATGAAQAGTVPADKYGYNYRVRDAYTDGARSGKFDPFTEGARTGKFDPFTEGARASTVAGLDRSGVSAEPARSADPYTDGARMVAGLDRSGVSAEPARSADPYTDGARGNGKRNPFYDGARSGKADPYLDGANA